MMGDHLSPGLKRGQLTREYVRKLNEKLSHKRGTFRLDLKFSDHFVGLTLNTQKPHKKKHT